METLLVHALRAPCKQGALVLNNQSSFVLSSSATSTRILFTSLIGPSSSSVKSMSTTICDNRNRLIVNSTSTTTTYSALYSQRRNLADKKEVSDKVEEFRKGKFDTIPNPSGISHFKSNQVVSSSHSAEEVEKKTTAKKAKTKADHVDDDLLKERPPIGEIVLPHPIWNEQQVNSVKVTHKEPEGFVDKFAYATVKLFRGGFDVFSGFLFGERSERKWLNRICFLETVAGVPGMVAAMLRHMKSLRRLQRDQGWIHTLLEEAENERMHLMTALQLKKPSLLFRMSVIGSQGVFVTMFGACYLVSPRFCHRFVGYLEEEAVKTYTKLLEDMDHGPMQHWNTQPAPDVAILYWKLDSDATMRDVVLAIRADEAHHRVVNHSLASLKEDEFNPYKPGK